MTTLGPYGCWNKPRPQAWTTIPAHDGYTPPREQTTVIGYRTPKVVMIKHTMSTECRYDKSATDPRCAGCEHINQGAI